MSCACDVRLPAVRRVEMPRLARAALIDTTTAAAGARRIQVVWSTGVAVRRSVPGLFGGRPFDEILSMRPEHVRLDRLNSGAPLLNTHDRVDLYGVIGVVERAWLENGAGRAIVRFSRRPDVDPVWRDVLDGVIRNVSVGYRVYRYEEVPGFTPPRLLATDWEPEEVSLVPVGADAGAGVRSLSSCVITGLGRNLSIARARLRLAAASLP